MTVVISRDLSKAIQKAIKDALDAGLGTFAQNAAAIKAVCKLHPELSRDNAFAVVQRWRNGK